MPKEIFHEQCWFLYGFNTGLGRYFGILRHHSIGTAANVSFDWEKVIDNRRFLGWLHTHPKSIGVSLSATDYKTMVSWVKTQGRHMLCAIESEGEDSLCHEFAPLQRYRSTDVYVRRRRFVIWNNIFFYVRPLTMEEMTSRNPRGV